MSGQTFPRMHEGHSGWTIDPGYSEFSGYGGISSLVPSPALNGGPLFKFNEAVSLQVYCETQDEIDYYWQRLSEGGDPKAQQCGWLKDQYGLSWQVVPTGMDKMLKDHKSAKAERVMAAVMQMKKFDLAGLKRAAKG